MMACPFCFTLKPASIDDARYGRRAHGQADDGQCADRKRHNPSIYLPLTFLHLNRNLDWVYSGTSGMCDDDGFDFGGFQRINRNKLFSSILLGLGTLFFKRKRAGWRRQPNGPSRMRHRAPR